MSDGNASRSESDSLRPRAVGEAVVLVAGGFGGWEARTADSTNLDSRFHHRLRETLLADAIHRCESLRADVYLCNTILLARNTIVKAFGGGAERILVLNATTVLPPDEFLSLAFDALYEPMSVAIGPTPDGLCYLIGVNDFFDDLFEEPFIKSGAVQRLTSIAATQAGSVAILPDWPMWGVATAGELRDFLIEYPALSPQTARFFDALSPSRSSNQ